MELDHQQLEANELFEAQCHIYKHMYHYMESMSLKCVVQLGIPDIIHKHTNPITLSQLVSTLQIPPQKINSLQRVMRILVHSGFFAIEKIHNHPHQEEEEEGYVHISSSTLLLKENPSTTSLSKFVLAMTDPALTDPWFSFAENLQGNNLTTTFETYHGMNFWDYGKANLEFSNSLNEAMGCDSGFVVSLIVKEHKEIFKGILSLVDVGGGTGILARIIADEYPEMICTVLDLPHIITNLSDSKNLKFVAGDMFQSVPSSQAVILKSVLHNWSDEACIKVLKLCKKAIPSKDEGGKVIIIEMVINEKKDNLAEETKLFLDMKMMLLFNGGRERNEKEWGRLFFEAGFNHYKITHTNGLNSIIEVFP